MFDDGRIEELSSGRDRGAGIRVVSGKRPASPTPPTSPKPGCGRRPKRRRRRRRGGAVPRVVSPSVDPTRRASSRSNPPTWPRPPRSTCCGERMRRPVPRVPRSSR
ncbi:MAG: DNA gyrase modulator [Acidimicrobiales bacterium]